MSISWDTSEVENNLQSLAPRIEAAVYATMSYYATRVETRAKSNAPWTDRTGNARNTMTGRAYRERGDIGIVLFHQMPYGIWLEVSRGGMYAIIMPTLDAMGPEVMDQLRSIIGRL